MHGPGFGSRWDTGFLAAVCWTSHFCDYYYYYYYLLLFTYIIIIEGSISRVGDITPNIFLAHTHAGAESDLNAAAAAPSQTEVTDLNCSDHSTTLKWSGKLSLLCTGLPHFSIFILSPIRFNNNNNNNNNYKRWLSLRVTCTNRLNTLRKRTG